MTPDLPRRIPIGNQIVEQWLDLEIRALVREIQEIDPNLVLCKNDRGEPLLVHPKTGGDGWYVFAHMPNATKADLMRLPQLLRERDTHARHNQGRNLALEAIEKQERQWEEQRSAKIEALEATWDRLAHGLRKDLGYGRRLL